MTSATGRSQPRHIEQPVAGSILGNRVVRVEDPRLLVGGAGFIENLSSDGVLHVTFVRSPVAHARIVAIDVSAAAAAPGVVAVFAARDLELAPQHLVQPVHEECARPPLADDRVRFVGEAVAAVVSETPSQGADAVELVVVDYDPLDAVVDPESALEPDAPILFDAIGTNLIAGVRDCDGTEDVLAGADVIARGRFVNQRMAVVPIETNGILVVPGAPGDEWRLTVHLPTQLPHTSQTAIAEACGLEASEVRVISPDMGGGFGGKAAVVAEHHVAIAIARHLNRPVKWIETRSENMVGLPHGRGQVQYIELGVRNDGTFVGLRCRILGEGGSYAGFGGGFATSTTRMMAQGVYRIPRIDYAAATAVTNTTPVGAFRGAGRPEAAAFLERVVDLAAQELAVDPVWLRRQNLLHPDEFPVTTVVGTTYDNGDYAASLDLALEMAGYEELRAEQAARRTRGDRKLLGIGVSTYVEITAGGFSGEFASVEVDAEGGAEVRVGTSAHGQGHATAFAMIVSDRLGIPMERIRLVQSDTALIPRGIGTGGSRSLQLGGSAIQTAAGKVLDAAKRIVANHLEAAPEDIVLDDGRLSVAGVPARGVSWTEAVALAQEVGESLVEEVDFEQAQPTFPFGAHVSVVEVDADTGAVTVIRHIAVDDCGRVLNPLLVEGQQHGGVASGIAQALWEEIVYDGDGNPLTSTLADYGIPSAAEFPSFDVANTETPTPLNPLGAKGIGESGTVGSTPAVQNAVIDAVQHLGVRHIDMPCTPQRVWQAMRDAAAGAADPWRPPPAVFETLPLRADTESLPGASTVEL